MLMRALGFTVSDKLKMIECKENCQIGNASEMHLYKANDDADIQFLVTFPVNCADSTARRKFSLEILVEKRRFFTTLAEIPGCKLNSLEISGQFDLNEKMFRNFPGVLGQIGGNPTLKHNWTFEATQNLNNNRAISVSVVWIDPEGATFMARRPVQIVNGTSVYHSILKLASTDSTLKPGIWKAMILKNSKSVAETEFAIFPDVTGNENLANELASKSYSVGKACISAASDFMVQMHGCQTLLSLPNCAQSKWSSMFPDTKSDISRLHNG